MFWPCYGCPRQSSQKWDKSINNQSKRRWAKVTVNDWGCAVPGDGALLFVGHSLDVGELQKALVEIVQMQDTHQQEPRGNEDSSKESRNRELLQPEILQPAQKSYVINQKTVYCYFYIDFLFLYSTMAPRVALKVLYKTFRLLWEYNNPILSLSSSVLSFLHKTQFDHFCKRGRAWLIECII